MANIKKKEKHTTKSFSHHCKEGDGELSEILRLLQSLISREDGKHVSFDRVNVEGSNVGAVMNIHQSKAKELPADRCSINIYVSNNIQGVTNSILVGSEVKMAESGLGLSFGDVTWDRDKSSKASVSKLFHRFGFTAVFLLLVFSLLLPFFGGRKT